MRGALKSTVGVASILYFSSLWNWIRLSRAGKLKATGDAAVAVRWVTEVEGENRRLRRELASTKLDLEIVKETAAYFAKESR